MRDFERDFCVESVIRLEQNATVPRQHHRCGQRADQNNSGRLGKNLWTDRGAGSRSAYSGGLHGPDEARWIVEEIQSWSGDGASRANGPPVSFAQSRVLEHQLFPADLPIGPVHGSCGSLNARRSACTGVSAFDCQPDDDTAFTGRQFPTPRHWARSVEALQDAART